MSIITTTSTTTTATHHAHINIIHDDTTQSITDFTNNATPNNNMYSTQPSGNEMKNEYSKTSTMTTLIDCGAGLPPPRCTMWIHIHAYAKIKSSTSPHNLHHDVSDSTHICAKCVADKQTAGITRMLR